jgi:hypothetical protein
MGAQWCGEQWPCGLQETSVLVFLTACASSRHVSRAQPGPWLATKAALRDGQLHAAFHAKTVWTTYAAATGGGSGGRVRWRSIVRMTSPWVMAAMRRVEPLRHRGQRVWIGQINGMLHWPPPGGHPLESASARRWRTLLICGVPERSGPHGSTFGNAPEQGRERCSVLLDT